VLVSSHLLAEMQLLADHLLVIGRGRLLADEPTDRLLGRSRRSHVLVRSPDAGRLAGLLVGRGATVQQSGAGELTVFGVSTQVVGELAHQHRLRLHELASRAASLEAAFLELVGGEVEYLQAGAGRQ
jgi:ABC-2 type transport system ATP-binding protein